MLGCAHNEHRRSTKGTSLRRARAARGGISCRSWGRLEANRPLPCRPGLGHRAWGLQRRRRRLALLSVRSRPLTRLPLERGRPSGALRPRAAPLFRSLVLERARPDPEGADLRPQWTGGQSRRGREGILVVSRRDAHLLLAALALSLSPSRVPVSAPAAGECKADTRAAGIRASRHRRF